MTTTRPPISRVLPGPEPALKQHRDGTHRTVAPARTVERVMRRRRELGITRLADVTGLDRIGVPVTMATRPNARSLAVNQGKGLTLDAARASGAMEAAETFHAEHPQLPLRLGSWRRLDAEVRTADCSLLPLAPRTGFDADLELLWAPGVDLLSQEETWVPYELVHTHYTTTQLPGQSSFLASSNGLASGNHPLEAVVHGLYEVIERDATVLWELSSPAARQATAIDTDTVADPGCRWVLDRFAAADVLVAVWEQTTDVGLPVFGCEIIDATDGMDAVPAAAGMGAHHDRGIALSRALTEAAQSRLTTIAGSRDDQPRSAYARGHDAATLRAHRAELAATASAAERPHDTAAGLLHDTFDEDLRDLLDRLTDAGIEQVIAVDLSRPQLGIDVVRVVVPGLEHLAFDESEFIPGPRAERVLAVDE